jgi:hypothetical protein
MLCFLYGLVQSDIFIGTFVVNNFFNVINTKALSVLSQNTVKSPYDVLICWKPDTKKNDTSGCGENEYILFGEGGGGRF